MEYFA